MSEHISMTMQVQYPDKSWVTASGSTNIETLKKQGHTLMDKMEFINFRIIDDASKNYFFDPDIIYIKEIDE